MLAAGFSPEWDEVVLPDTSCPSWFNAFGVTWTCEDSQPARQCHAQGEGLCRIGNIVSTVTRITAKNGRKKNPERSRQEMKLSVHGGFKCLGRVPFRAALSAELFCNRSASPCSNVRSAASHCILASSVRTSIPRAGSSARNRFPRESRARMKLMNVRSIPYE